MKDTTNEKKGWEEEFDKEFLCTCSEGCTSVANENCIEELKLFISKVEQEAYERGRRDMEEQMLKKNPEKNTIFKDFVNLQNKAKEIGFIITEIDIGNRYGDLLNYLDPEHKKKRVLEKGFIGIFLGINIKNDQSRI